MAKQPSTNAEVQDGVMLSDEVYMIVHDQKGLWYSPPATNPNDCWDNLVNWENSQGHFTARENLYKEGWRARKVTVIINEAR